jgi:hypothetical protein
MKKGAPPHAAVPPFQCTFFDMMENQGRKEKYEIKYLTCRDLSSRSDIIDKMKYFLLSFLLLILAGCHKKDPQPPEEQPLFSHEQIVTIRGYNGDAMEPFISRDDRYLFFNNLKGDNNKDLYYAEKIDDTTFTFRGVVQGVNTSYVDANPTMDTRNHFYFISTRELDSVNKTLFRGIFQEGTVTASHRVEGSINIVTPYWINMGVEVSGDGTLLFVSNARFEPGGNFPVEGNIRFAVKEGEQFNIPANETEILARINNDRAIQYAGELSADGLELFYSEVTLSDPPRFRLLRSERADREGTFEAPSEITEPFRDDPYAVVEAPTLSADGRRLYYHKLDKTTGIFRICMLTRKK